MSEELQVDLKEQWKRVRQLEYKIGDDGWFFYRLFNKIKSPSLLERIEALEHKVGIYHDNAEGLEELFETLDSLTLQNVFREVAANELVFAMMGFKPQALLKVKNNVSKTSWKMLVEDMVYQLKWGIDKNSVLRSRSKIMSILIKLGAGKRVAPPSDAEQIEALEQDHSKNWDKAREQDKKEREAETKALETWKKEVFDALDKV